MAKKTQTGHPIDEPVLERPGVMHKEGEYHGNAKYYGLPPEHSERAKKGDLGLEEIQDFPSRSLSHSGLPFVLKGK